MTAKSTVFYLTKFIFPLQLSVLYPNKNPIQLAFPDFQIALVSLILIFAFVFWSLRKTRSIFFGFMFFFLAISPTFLHFNRKGSLTDGAVSGIQFASDHYMYVPMIGLVFLVTLLVQTLWSRETMMRKRSKGKDLLFGSLLVILLTFSGLSFTQAAVWKDSKTLFEHTLSIYPYSTASRVGLSVVFRKSGNIEKEKQVLQDGLEFGDSAILHAGLGALEVRTGNFFAAEREYEAALLADPSNAEVHFGLGTLLSAQGKNDQAMNAYLKALSLDPLYPAAENNIGSLLIEKGDEVAAKEHFLKAVEINPAFREGYVNLARVSMTAQQFEESIEWYTKAIELDPNDLLTHIELAQVYLQTGKNTAAFEEIKAVLQKDPNNAPAKALVKEMVRLGILGNG